MISWIENLYVSKNRFFKFSFNFHFLVFFNFFGNFYCRKSIWILLNHLWRFVYSRKDSQSLYLIPQVLYFLLSYWLLHLVLWILWVRLLTRFDNVLCINCNLQNIFFITSSAFVSILVISFCIGTDKVMHFSVFFPKQVNCFSNSSTNSFIIKW